MNGIVSNRSDEKIAIPAYLTEFCPAHCWRKKIKKAMTNRMKFPFPKNASFRPSPFLASLSSRMAASISAISCSTSIESIRSLRR